MVGENQAGGEPCTDGGAEQDQGGVLVLEDIDDFPNPGEDDNSSASTTSPVDFNPLVIADDGPTYSLAFYKTTPHLSRVVISLLMVGAHLMYLYGQVFPMWRLYYMVNVDVNLTATNAESKLLFSQLGLTGDSVHIKMNEEKDIDTFTYGFAVKQLWLAKNLGSKFGPRFAAAILVLFSGIWPHMKLLLLNFYFRKPVSEITRTTAFYWLSTFGKFSLADVFVVCVMIGVLNLDLAINPGEIRQGLINELPEAVNILKKSYSKAEAEVEICSKLLKLGCDHWYDLKCSTCKTGVGYLYDHPSIVESVVKGTLDGVKTSGNGAAELRIAGLHGIYIFCFGVIISLLLSFFIDVIDHRAKAKNAKSKRGQPPAGALGVTGSPGYSYYSLVSLRDESNDVVPFDPRVTTPGPSHEILPVGKDTSGAVLLIRRVSRRVWPMRNYVMLVIGSFVGILLVCLGIFVNSMEREVPGSLPEIANKILGIQWTKQYSLWTLTEVTGASGGPDFLLMGTFAIFVVVGPVLRSALCTLDLVVPMSKTMHKKFMTMINFLGAFCAWEVFFIALFLVDLEMPQITNTIIDDDDTTICQSLAEAGFPRSCFEVEFNVLDPFFFIMIGGSLLMLVASMSVKLGFKGLDPYLDGDRGGPYCCDWCPYVLFDFDRDIRFAKELEAHQALLHQDHLVQQVHHHHHHYYHAVSDSNNENGVRSSQQQQHRPALQILVPEARVAQEGEVSSS